MCMGFHMMSEHAGPEAYVSCSHTFTDSLYGSLTSPCSSTPARRASCALLPPRSNHTATLQTLTAVMVATQTPTKATELSMVPRRSLSSRVSSVARPLARRPRLLLRLHRPLPAPEHALLCMDSVVVKGGLGRLAVPLEAARLPTLIILSACEMHGIEGFVGIEGRKYIGHNLLSSRESEKIARPAYLPSELCPYALLHLPILSLNSFTRLSALSSRFIPSLIAVESSTFRGQVLKIRSMTGSVSSLTY